MKATAVQAMTPSTLVSESSSRCSGDRVRFTSVSMVAMRPISVCMPVAVMTTVEVPRVTDVFWKTMSVRSPNATSPGARVPPSLATGALSPVSAASCTSRVADRRMRPSAGTRSPASRRTMSPGTRSTAGTMLSSPARTTFASGTCIFDSASTLARAASSCRAPSTTFSSTSSPTITAVETSPIARLTATTASSMMFIGSRNCLSATAHTDGGFSPTMRLGPYRVSPEPASAPRSPWVASLSIAVTTSATSRENQAGRCLTVTCTPLSR
jgi:hypothetical protein